MSGAEHELDLGPLRDALAQLAARDADEVLAEARAQARARVSAALTDALTRSLGEAIERQLGPATSSKRDAELAAPAQRAAPAPAIDPGAQPDNDGIYVYGIVWAPDTPLTEELAGLDLEHPVTTAIEGPLAAVISRVALAEFEEEALRSRLSDIEWVERVARAHEGVLDDLCARTVVVPMRMCTVYRSEENLRSMLQSEEVNLRSALEFLDGKLEWGVKVIAHADAHGLAPDAASAADDARSASSGADYLARRRARRDQEAEIEDAQADVAAQIHETLGSLAHDGLLNPTQSTDLPAEDGRVIMNGVYLVEREVTEIFHQEVQGLARRFAEHGLELVQTGPWPPYNFVPGDVGAAW